MLVRRLPWSEWTPSGHQPPGLVVMQHYGFTVENVCKQTHNLLQQIREKP
jgi:hypothetical protein